MISNNFPHNRLQREKLRRFNSVVLLHLGLVLSLLVGLFFFVATPVYAASILADCENPVEGAYSVVPEGKDYIWWIGEAFTRNGLCMVAWWDSDSDGQDQLNYNPFVTGYNYWVNTGKGGMVGRSWDGNGYNTVEALLTNSHRSVLAAVDIATGDSYFSSFSLYAGGSDGTDYDGATGIYNNGDLILSGSVLRVLNLTSSGSLVQGVSREYQIDWSGFLSPNQINHVFWYPYGRAEGDCGSSGGCPFIYRVINGTDLADGSTGTGSLTWAWTYPYAGTYSGAVIVTTSCGELSLNTGYDSCDKKRQELYLVIAGEEDEAVTYSGAVLDFPVGQGSQGANRLVGESQPYEWVVDPNMCSDSSVSGVRIFRGYPYPQDTVDQGILLVGSSGSGTLKFDFESPVLKSSFYPYVHVYCADGGYHRIYNGSTTYPNEAVGLYIVSAGWTEYWVSDWEVGGDSSDYNGTGSGTSFWIEKAVVERYEPVRMNFEFNVDFVVGDLAIYPDPVQVSEFYVVDDANLILEDLQQNYSIVYDTAGSYFPKIRVRSVSYDSGNPATYRDIWLGGEQVRNNGLFVKVTNARFLSNQLAVSDGIFGLDPSVFSVSLGDSDNLAIKTVEVVVSYVIRGALYIASFAYSIVKEAPVFSFVVGTMNPPDGVCYILPTQICYAGRCLPLPENLDPDGEFCVSYVEDDVMFTSTLLALQFMFAMSIFFYILRKFF